VTVKVQMMAAQFDLPRSSSGYPTDVGARILTRAAEEGEPNGAAIGSVTMQYRGVEYTITQGTQPDVWRWRVMVGKPEMLRMGEATTQMHAELQVRQVIDRALDLQKSLRSPGKTGGPG
jgi:hypothetical protein